MTPVEDSVPPIVTSPNAPIYTGVVIILVFIGGFLLWSLLTVLASGVLAAGSVRVDTSRKQIQHLEGGIVAEILVRDGDMAEAGQPLVLLDKTRAGTSMELIRQGLETAQASKARLLAEQEDAEEIEFPEPLAQRTSDPKALEIMKSQRLLFEARRTSLKGQIQILDQQILHLREQIQGLNAQQNAKASQIDSIEGELEGLRGLLARGLIDKTRVLALERDGAELAGERGELISQIAAANSNIGEKELEKFQLMKSFKESVSNELKEVQAEVHDYTERLLAARHVLDQTELKSPVDGVVVGSGVHTVGGVVSPGAVLMEIVPVHDRLIIEAAVSPQDIDNVRAGLAAGVKFTAFNQREVPEIQGVVTYVAADIFEDSKSEESYYKARIEVEDSEILRLGDRRIQPGMTADIVIRTINRRPIDYLLEPLISSARKAWRES